MPMTKRERNNEMKNIDNAIAKLNEITKCAAIDVEDEFSVFGKSIACQLRQLSLQGALEVQVKYSRFCRSNVSRKCIQNLYSKILGIYK